MIQTLINLEVNHTFKFTDNNIIIKGTLPKSFYFTEIFDIAADCIDEIKFKDKYICLVDFNIDDKKEILTKLPSFILPNIIEYLQTQDQTVKQCSLISLTTQKAIPFTQNFNINMFDGSMGEIIKILYNMQLNDFYNNEYTLMRRFKFGYDAIMDSTPGELAVFYDIINRDLEKEKKQMDQQNNPGGISIPTNSPADD